MRYLNRQTLNRRTANDVTLYVDANQQNFYVNVAGSSFLNSTNTVYMNTNTGSLILPTGNSSQTPSSTVVGMMRYNTTTNEVQVYQGSAWRSMRFKEATSIIQQNLGAGDSNAIYFGPLSSSYNPSNVSSDMPVSGAGSYGGQNIIVYVEQVPQLSGINYIVVQNPTIGAETYTPTTSVAATTGSTTLYFNSSLYITNASGNGTTVTLTLANTTGQVPFAIGSTIIVTGILPTGYNGTYTVTSTSNTATTVSFASAFSTTYQNGGTVTSTQGSGAVYPAVSLLGGTVTGTDMASSSTLSGVSVVNTTYQFSCTSTTLAVNQAVTISGTLGGVTITGYTNPTTYYITSTNGTTGFTLSATPGGSSITVSTGTPTGVTFTLPVSVLSYTTDSNTDALTSVTISKATVTATLPVNSTLTITEAAQTITNNGYYLKFSTPVPYGKVVVALLGFDQ